MAGRRTRSCLDASTMRTSRVHSRIPPPERSTHMAAPRALHYAAAVSLLVTAVTSVSAQAPAKTLPEQIADVMVQLNGGIHPGFRFTHAKGLVASGSFTPAPSAKTISRAAHLQDAT